MLAFVGLLLFALLGISALVLDLGVASLAQQRLETAAELVALQNATGTSHEELQARAGGLLANQSNRPTGGLRLGPVAPLDSADSGCAGALPEGSAGRAVLAQRVPLLFGHASMVSFASHTSWGELLTARTATPNPDPTPVLPDSATPPGRRALREQGICVQGRSRATLVPALAVAGVEQRTLPATALGLSLLATETNTLWQSRALTRETRCLAAPQGGSWFELVTGPNQSCQPTDAACTMPVTQRAARVGSSLSGTRVALLPAVEPLDADMHRSVVAPLRDTSESVIGFATLCARRVGASVFVAMRWNDSAIPFTAFTSELHDPTIRDLWRSVVQDLDEACRHPEDQSLTCLVQSAALSLPGTDA